jgi:hypothetical protein
MTSPDSMPRKSLPARLDAAKTPLVCIVLVFFEAFSIGSTGTGLHGFFNGFSGLPTILVWPLVLSLAAGFHVLAVAWFFGFRQTRRWRAALPYLIFSLVFVGFSWSWHWSHFRGAEVAQQDLSSKVEELERTLYTAQTSFALIVGKTEELAAYSDERAREEDKKGGTCGDSAGGTQGKRYWVRMDDKRELRSVADTARGHLRRLSALVDEARNLADAHDGILATSRRLDVIGNELTAFAADDAVVSDIRDRMNQRLRLSRDGYNVPGHGLTRCPDPTRDSLLAGVVNAAKMPPVTVVHVMNPDSMPEAQKRIWGRAGNTLVVLWAALWGGKIDKAVVVDQLNFHDYVALATSSFVEFSVLMCLLWLPRPRGGIGALAEQVEGLDQAAGRKVLAAFSWLGEGRNSSNMAALKLLDEHLWWPNSVDTPILLVPVAPSEKAMLNLYRFAELLVELDLAQIPRAHLTYRRRLNRRETPARFRTMASECTVRLYTLNRHAYRQLMIALSLQGFMDTAHEATRSTWPPFTGPAGPQRQAAGAQAATDAKPATRSLALLPKEMPLSAE